MEFKTLKKAALFVDYENANATDSYNPLLKKLSSLGYNPFIRKIISSKIPEMDGFDDIVKENEFEFVLSNKVLKKGSSAVIKKKNLNNADFRVYIEVLKVLYTKDIDTFVIYTSDDDYIDLICAIKREGKEVIGVGNKITTSSNYISLFHNFIFVEDLLPVLTPKEVKQPKADKIEAKKEKKKPKKEKKEKKKIVEVEPNEKEQKVEKNDIFYSILKDSTNSVLQEAKDKNHNGAYLIANIVSKLKENYPYLKNFKKISPDDFKKCGFKIKYQDGKKVKSYIDLDTFVIV